MNKKVTAC